MIMSCSPISMNRVMISWCKFSRSQGSLHSTGNQNLCLPLESTTHPVSRVMLHKTSQSCSGGGLCVEQAHSIFYILQQYSTLTLGERGEGRAGEAGCCLSE